MNTDENKNPDPEIDLIELIGMLWDKRLYICKIAGVSVIIGFIIAISIPREYTCTVKMAPEGAKSSISGNMSDLASIAGIDIGQESTDGLNLILYPDVVQSMPMITELSAATIRPTGKTPGKSVYNYIRDDIRKPWWKSILEAPFKLSGRIKYGKEKEDAQIDPYHLSMKQYMVFGELKKRINVSINKKTGMINASVKMQDPEVAAIIADSLVSKLERFVIDYRINKAKQDFEFSIKIFNDAKKKYYDAQNNYADFVDANRNIILETVRIEQERLKNELSLSYNVYSSLAQQVEKSRMKVQEQTPSMTIIEPARVPVQKSNASKSLILMIFVLLGGLAGSARVIYSGWNKIYVVK